MRIIKYIKSKTINKAKRKIKTKVKSVLNPFYGRKGKRRKRLMIKSLKRIVFNVIFS